MCRKLICIVSAVLVLGLVSQAAEITWIDNQPDDLWSTPGNWQGGSVPGDEDDALIYYNPDTADGPVIDLTVTAVCDRLKTGWVVAEGDGTVLTITGGSLDVGDWFGHAEDEGTTATMNVSGGTVTFTRTMAIGQGAGAYGVLNMTGGLIQIYGQEEEKDGLWVTVVDGSTGHVQLDGGRIETRQLLMHTHEDTQASIDITGGVLVVDGSPDTPSPYGPGFSVQHCIDEGWITAYGGSGQLVVEYDEVLDETTIWAYFLGMATNPSPLDLAENVCPGVTLSWTAGEYCVDDHNVYFGTSLDYVSEGAEPCLPHHDTNSFTPSLEMSTTYYWRVEEVNDACEASPWAGIIWQFTTGSGNAFDPSPPNGLQGVSVDVTLSWTPGCLAASHTLYLGTNYDDVNNGSGGTNKGSQDPGYDPDLQRFTTYYWRVEAGPSLPGDIWTFRTGLGGVLMYYKFDGTQGLDLPSPITDLTGNVTFTKYTDIGSVKYGDGRFIGTSADFDPCAGLYRVDACDPGGWDLLRLDGSQYTIEMWLKPEVLSQEHVDPDNDTWLIGKRGSWRIYINDPDPGNNNTAYSWVHAGNNESMFDDSAVEGEWAHLAVVYNQTDESEQRMQFYLNGMLQESTEETGLNPADNNNMVTIGMEELAGGGFTGFFDGLIDELRVLDVALTPCDFLVVPGPEWASCPSPANGEEGVDPCEASLALTWTPGIYVDKHNIYFGTSLDDVNESADPCVLNHDTNSWTPPPLEFGTIYYWRVDEVNGFSEWTGVIWQFTTRYEIPDPNLLLWYKFDETSGDDVFDSSGHGLHGDTDDMDDEDWEPNNGHIEGCLSFDGGGRVDVPSSVLTPIDKKITVAVWLNGGSSSGDNWVFSTGFEPIPDYVVEAAVPTASETVSWRAGNDTNDVLIWEEVSPAGWVGEWHHFAFVKDEDANTMTIYFDGLAVDKKTGVSDKLAYARNREFKIGARYDEEDGYVGKIDDFRIYDYAMSAKEIAVLFREDLGIAWGPSPYHGQADAPCDADLIWRPGDWASSHEVYFGTSRDDVNDANNSWDVGTTVYKGKQGPNTYDPGILTLDQTYYWRIDEVNDTNDERWKGNLWRFKVANYIVIDDMEEYTELGEGHDIFTGWADGSTNMSNSWLYIQIDTPVLDKQSMKFHYDNTFNIVVGYYSEIETKGGNLDPNNWTVFDLRTLSLWFYGKSDNDADATEQMYVGLEDSDGTYAEVRYPMADMDDIRVEEWQLWEVLLSDFTNVNMAKLEKLFIGFGTRGGFLPGGMGDVHFDDIRVYPAYCVPEEGPKADLSGNCIVDFADIEIMADEWLEADVNLGEVKEPCDANLVGWWKLDEAAADTNIAHDYSGYDNNGVIETLNVDVWWVAAGHDGNALEFDGGVVEIADDGNTPELRPERKVTVMTWINRAHSVDNEEKVVVKGRNDWETYALEVSDENRARFFVRDANNVDNQYTIDSPDELPVNSWVHVAGTYDGNELTVYVNGQVAANSVHPLWEKLVADANDGFAIAGRWGDSSGRFIGTIDDVRVYNYALLLEEVAYIATDTTGIFSVQSVANLYNKEDLGERAVNLRDFAELAKDWLEKKMWPQ